MENNFSIRFESCLFNPFLASCPYSFTCTIPSHSLARCFHFDFSRKTERKKKPIDKFVCWSVWKRRFLVNRDMLYYVHTSFGSAFTACPIYGEVKHEMSLRSVATNWQKEDIRWTQNDIDTKATECVRHVHTQFPKRMLFLSISLRSDARISMAVSATANKISWCQRKSDINSQKLKHTSDTRRLSFLEANTFHSCCARI